MARILREQPEWADTIRGLLLGEELLNLPAQLAEFVQVSQENNRQVREELAQQRQLLGQHSAQLTQHGAQLTQHQRDAVGPAYSAGAGPAYRAVGPTQRPAGPDQRECRTQHGEQLTQHTAQLTQISEVQAQHGDRMDGFHARMEGFHARMDRMEGRLSNVEGSAYERNVRAKALFRAQHRLGLAEPYIALTQDGQAAPQLHRAISRALSSGVLSLDQSSEVYDTDLILSGADNRHVVIEVSITAGEEDISRARRRADYLALATGGTATPAVITAVLDEAQRAQAAEQEVATFIVPYP